MTTHMLLPFMLCLILIGCQSHNSGTRSNPSEPHAIQGSSGRIRPVGLIFDWYLVRVYNSSQSPIAIINAHANNMSLSAYDSMVVIDPGEFADKTMQAPQGTAPPRFVIITNVNENGSSSRDIESWLSPRSIVVYMQAEVSGASQTNRSARENIITYRLQNLDSGNITISWSAAQSANGS